MPWNGAGVFQRIHSWLADQAADIYVRADRMDEDSDDIADGISNCIARDGQAPPTANISFGGFKITNLANGAAGNDAVNYAQVFISPVFTGNPTAPTQADGNSSTRLATTAFAMTMYSPAFRGTPTAPTAASGASGSQIATLDFVNNKAFTTATSAYTYTTTAVSKSVAAGEDCLVTGAGVTITVPAAPADGALVFVGTASGITDTIIDGNGNTIIGDSTFTMDTANRYVTLKFRTGYGWRVM